MQPLPQAKIRFALPGAAVMCADPLNMNRLSFFPVQKDGSIQRAGELPEFIAQGAAMSRDWYAKVGYEPPWIGYVAFDGNECVGMCGFKTAPQEGASEIAYGTARTHEGKGYATQMARQLIELAAQTAPEVKITAQTLPEKSASTSVLQKLGFVHAKDVQHPEDGLVWEWHLPKS